MKSKAMTYVLIVVVLAVWGVVAKKIFFSKPSGDAAAYVKPPSGKPRVEGRDTLLLNYRDPFLGDVRRERPKPATSTAGDGRRPLPPKPMHDKPEKIAFRYLGLLGKRGDPCCLIEDRETHYTLRKGDALNDFTLTAVFPDSVHFTKAGNHYTVKLSP